MKAEQDLTLISNSPAITKVVNQGGKETPRRFTHYGLVLLQTPDRQIYCFWLTVDPFPAEYISAKFHYSFNNRILSANIIRHYLCTGTRNNFDDWKMVGASYLLVGRCQVWNVIVLCDQAQC